MKNYRDSDYAANKYASGIVYRFTNETVEITLEDYLRENPGRTAQDFAELKALSDELFLQQARSDSAHGKKTARIQDAEKTIHTATPSTEETVIDAPEREAAEKYRQEIAQQALAKLTEVQRRRYLLYHVDGKTEEEIAELEETTHQAISKSLLAANRKIKKIFTTVQKQVAKTALKVH